MRYCPRTTESGQPCGGPMRKRILLLIQGNDDLKQTYYCCEKCGAEMTGDASKGDTLLFWKGQFVRVILNFEPTDPRLFS